MQGFKSKSWKEKQKEREKKPPQKTQKYKCVMMVSIKLTTILLQAIMF